MKKWSIILALTAILVLSGVLIAGAKEKITLNFIDWSYTREQWIRPVISKFEKAYPDIKINFKRLAFAACHDGLQTAFMAGKGIPEVVTQEISWFGRFFKGEERPFVDLTDLLAPYRPKLVEARLGPYTFFGRVWAIPNDVHPAALIYRRDFFSEAGLPSEPAEVEKLLANWEDFLEVGKKLTRPDRHAIFIPGADFGYLMMMVLQQGSWAFNEKGEVTLDNDINIRTLQFYVDMLNKYKIAAPSPAGAAFYSAIDEGKVAAAMGPDWHLGYIKKYTPKSAGKWGAIPLPVWPGYNVRTATWGGSAFAITKACKYPEAAWEFMKFAFLEKENGVIRWLAAYQLPPLKEIIESPGLRVPDPYFTNQTFGELMAKLALEVPVYYMSIYWPEAATYWAEAVGHAVAMKKTPEEALKEAAEKVRKIMK